ncbi:MAG: four helix bundle protein, partial [bacterium]|nr:four helix bundle protein [bacterium]
MSVLKDCYLMWHGFLPALPRLTRYTLAIKVDNLFTDLIAITLTAQYAKREQKQGLLLQMSERLDYLKYFITILWEAKGMETSQYSQISQKLFSAGNMLGKWIQS